jgi:NAD(P)-dependent dehydrogenase (short-subunit alcohol dehydrogenase family)
MSEEQPMGLFDGQVAVVTGGALGIGGATARRLAAEGARVLIADIDIDAASSNESRIKDAGGIAKTIRTDVGSHDDIREMVEAAVSEWGRLDVLVQNAYGVASTHDRSLGSAVTVPEAEWDRGMAVLTKALYLGAKYGVPEMAKSGGGSIVNLASVHGFLMAPEMLVYEAGKSAVIGMTKQMAIDFGPHGIRVNAICPGHILTEGLAKMWEGNEAGLDVFRNQYPVRRVGTPDDIANAIAFLCSADASFITGHALFVDGGLTTQLQENLGVQQAKYAREHPEARLP